MSEINIEVAGGSSVRLPTAGKYCDRNIVVTATGGGGADFTELESKLSNGFTDYSYYFYNRTKMTEAPAEILQHTASGTSFKYMFYKCQGLTEVPSLDTSGGTDFNRMFSNCSILKTIGGIDISNATDVTDMFYNVTWLENVTFNGVIKIEGLVFYYHDKLTHDSLMSIINALYDWAAEGSTSTYKLTLGSTNLAKLTDAEKAIATEKGWTLA